MNEYQNQVETKLRLISQELERLYQVIEKYSDYEVRAVVYEHKKIYIALIRAYEKYVCELKDKYGDRLTELPRYKGPSSRFGGNS